MLRNILVSNIYKEVFIMEANEIRVKVNGGYLIAGRNPDPDYDGIYCI